MSDDTTVIAWTLSYLTRLAEGLVAGFCGCVPAMISRAAWRAANKQLRIMEAMVRRVLVCMAVDMAIAPSGHSRLSGNIAATHPPAAPGFAIFDALAVPDFGVANASEYSAANPNPPAAIDTTSLTRRLIALRGVLDAPERAARRMALWLGQTTRRARRTPIRLGPLIRCKDALNPSDVTTSAHYEIHRRAIIALNRPP